MNFVRTNPGHTSGRSLSFTQQNCAEPRSNIESQLVLWNGGAGGQEFAQLHPRRKSDEQKASVALNRSLSRRPPTPLAWQNSGGAWTRQQSVALFLRLISGNSNTQREGRLCACGCRRRWHSGGGASEEAFGARAESERATQRSLNPARESGRMVSAAVTLAACHKARTQEQQLHRRSEPSRCPARDEQDAHLATRRRTGFVAISFRIWTAMRF